MLLTPYFSPCAYVIALFLFGMWHYAESMSFERRSVEWTPESVRRFWDYYSSNPGLEDTYFAKAVGRHVIDHVSSRIRIGTALDMGCGRGDLTEYLLNQHETYAVDQSPESVAHVSSRFGGHPLFRGAFVDSLSDGIADTVFLLEVVEHLDDETLSSVLTKAHRLLRPGGHLVVTTPNDENLELSRIMCPDCGCVFHKMQHVRSWTPRSLVDYVSRFGFSGSAHAMLLSNRQGVRRIAHQLFHRVTRRPDPNLIYIGRKITS